MSPASACCLRNCRRSPTRSTSAATLASLQRVPRPPPAELFLRNALDNCERLMRIALARFDLGAQPRDRPVAPVGHGFLQQGRDHAQSRFTLHRGRAGRHAGLQRLDAAAHEVAAPQANRVFAHAERLGDPRTGPAGQRQQHGAGPVRLAAITRTWPAPSAPRVVPRLPRAAIFQPCLAPANRVPAANQIANRWSTRWMFLLGPSGSDTPSPTWRRVSWPGFPRSHAANSANQPAH